MRRLCFACSPRRGAGALGMPLYGLSGGNHTLQTPFHIVGDGGEANLHARLCKPSPPHPAQAVASFPGPEYLLDPTTDTVDRLVPGIKACPDLGFVASPHTSGHDARLAAFGDDCLAEMVTAIRAVGINIAGISGNASGPAFPSLILAGVTATSSTRAGSASAPTCALKPWTAGRPLCLTQRPSPSSSLAEAMIVASTSVPFFTRIALFLSCALIASNRDLSRPWATRLRRKRTKAVRSGVGSEREKPQKRRNETRSSRACASFTSDRSYQIDNNAALNRASGGQAGSPWPRRIQRRALGRPAPSRPDRQGRQARNRPVGRPQIRRLPDQSDDGSSRTSIIRQRN